jgi:antitoxin HicB
MPYAKLSKPGLAFPARVKKGEDGFWLVTFRDVPEAGTDDRKLEVAVLEAADALTAALAGYLKDGRTMPSASKPRAGEVLIHAEPSFTAKVALRELMAEKQLSNVAFGKLLGLNEKEVRRMIDPDYPTKLDRLDAALRKLGHRVIVEVQPVAPSTRAA